MKNLNEVLADRKQAHPSIKAISLNKLMKDNPIVDIEGHVSMEFGDPVFSINRLILQDGTVVFVEGEHDIAYVPPERDVPGLSAEQLQLLHDQDEN